MPTRGSLVMDAPTIPVPAGSSEGNFEDTMDISVDVIHLVPVASVVFLAATVVTTLAQHGEAIRGIQEHFLGVPIYEDLTVLRFKVDIGEVENALLRATIRTMEVIETVTRNHETTAILWIDAFSCSVRSPTVRTERTSGSSKIS
ncbi:hypothetical protein Tco_0628677 [Tanacetum coccineum]|uniref:Uncharacterized protein n=1 Tax=Tanacetum coccineum TaxID=301880 RepID=A0ABQ4WQZ4_9ASTR